MTRGIAGTITHQPTSLIGRRAARAARLRREAAVAAARAEAARVRSWEGFRLSGRVNPLWYRGALVRGDLAA